MQSVTTPLSSMSAVTIKSSLASRSENWVLLMFSSSLMVVFMAPVTPELHCEPKPMRVTRRTDISFQERGTGSVFGLLEVSD